MWVPEKVIDWFTTLNESAESAADNLSYLREELSATRAERDTIKVQLIINQTQFDWLRMRVNQLEYERAVMLEATTGLKFSSPMIAREAPPPTTPHFTPEFSFDDMGEDIASKLGFESHKP